MNVWKIICSLVLALWCAKAASAETNAASSTGATNSRPDYILVANDIVVVKVYQEDDLDARVRISKDGSIVLPLLGSVTVGGKTREQAARMIRDLLGEKYLVNPQISLDIAEYSKRRFTVLGQVQRPGSFEMPGDESVNLLQAISMAGGYTRLGAGNRVTLQRGQGPDKQSFKLDADSMAKDKDVKIFEVLADDTITVGEKIF
ncbi:MAG TPA: polysaccharide biosynthesis/export family protein [Candidatus Limnocylindria bacterium]|nr:polysaccharide biosynthesis/export family protein [Candidatus Limnocylindria bacterium]